MSNNNSEEFHVNNARLDTERLGRYPFTRQGLYQVVLFAVEIVIVCLGNDSACVGKGCEPRVLLEIWDSSAPIARFWQFGIPLLLQPGSKHLTQCWGRQGLVPARDRAQLLLGTGDLCRCRVPAHRSHHWALCTPTLGRKKEFNGFQNFMHFQDFSHFWARPKPQTELVINVKRTLCFQIPSFLKAAYFK